MDKTQKLIEKVKEITLKYPQFSGDFDEPLSDLSCVEHANFMCIQMYELHNEIFVPITLPLKHGSFLLEGIKGIYGPTHIEVERNTGEETRIWSLIKFTPRDIMNREITGGITYTKLR